MSGKNLDEMQEIPAVGNRRNVQALDDICT